MNRVCQPEILDESRIDPCALQGNLRDLARLNRWFGGTPLILDTLQALATDFPRSAPLQIVDAGTGSGDIPCAIVHWARRTGRRVQITACDAHPQVAAIARESCEPAIHVVQAGITQMPFPTGAFDFALCSLLLHHLTEPQIRQAVHELRRVARCAVVVTDLVRSRAAYASVVVATRLLSRNAITRNDGPLSVRRAFTLEEMKRISPELAWSACPGFRMIGIGAGQAATRTGSRRARDLVIQMATRQSSSTAASAP